MKVNSNLIRILFLIYAAVGISWHSTAIAAQLQLSWVDNSTDETGFKIERKTGTTGTYAQIASLGANVTSYTDSTLTNSTTYCYRVNAYNSNGSSPYSPEACATTPAATQTYSLAVTKAGTGSGTVSSSPAGINCGSTCSGTFNSGTVVALTATAASGSVFTGWTGDADCGDGSLTMNAGKSCTATFNLQTSVVNTVSTNIANNATLSGSSVIWTATATGSPARVEFLIDNALLWTEFASPYQFNGDPLGTLDTTTLTNSSHQLKVRAVYSDNSTAEQTLSVTVSNTSTQKFTLSVNVVKAVTSSGTGSGTVTSSPAGINCGSTCSASYNSGTVVTLTATPATGSTFAGWSGTGCSTGTVTMNASITCTATFNPQAVQTFGLSVTKSGNGTGTVTSSPAGINCGSTCSATFNSGVVVSLTATPVAGSTFAGWSGTGCNNGSVTMTSTIACTATFQSAASQLATRIGVFRPSTGEWFLDSDGNGILDCAADICRSGYGQVDMLPVVGDWYGSGKTNIGTFRPGTGSWHLDNGDGSWNTCGTTGDICIGSFGQQGDLPIVKEMSNSNEIIIGVFRPRTTSRWKFDTDGDGVLDSCRIDECYSFGTDGDLPVVGDWNGTGTEKIGVFRPGTGQWLLDLNGNGKWDGKATDRLFGTFGTIGDYPVVGDWDGTGKIRIGIFRPSTGEWFLDVNGNGKLDACGVDACIGPFGEAGDLPVVGKW